MFYIASHPFVLTISPRSCVAYFRSFWTGGREGRLTGYPEIGRAAYGSFGYYLVQFFHKTTLLGVCTIFLILAGLNFADVLEPSTGLDARAWYATPPSSARPVCSDELTRCAVPACASATTRTLITGAAVWVPMVVFKNMREISIMRCADARGRRREGAVLGKTG